MFHKFQKLWHSNFDLTQWQYGSSPERVFFWIIMIILGCAAFYGMGLIIWLIGKAFGLIVDPIVKTIPK